MKNDNFLLKKIYFMIHIKYYKYKNKSSIIAFKILKNRVFLTLLVIENKIITDKWTFSNFQNLATKTSPALNYVLISIILS